MAVAFDLSARGRIAAQGEDRKRLLHAMTTQHIEQLEPGQGAYAFFLNAQGRILADAWIFCRVDDLLLDLEAANRRKIYDHLDHYIIADDVTLVDQTEQTAELAVEGEGALEVFRQLGVELPPEGNYFVDWQGTLLALVSATGEPGIRVITASERKQELMESLASKGVQLAPEALLEEWRIRNGVPRYGHDLSERYIVQETGVLHAVHFSKGCYLGQEIVERVRARGLVKRRLAHFRLLSGTLAPPGEKILAGDQEVGEITSCAASAGAVYALGYCRLEHLAQPSGLRVGGAGIELLQH